MLTAASLLLLIMISPLQWTFKIFIMNTKFHQCPHCKSSTFRLAYFGRWSLECWPSRHVTYITREQHALLISLVDEAGFSTWFKIPDTVWNALAIARTPL